MKGLRRLPALALALWVGVAGGAVIDVKVFDAFGSAYATTRLGEQLGSLYDLDFETTLVLILGPRLDDERVTEQESICGALDPTEHGVLCAIGTPTQTYQRGFSITPNAAAELLPAPGAFRVLVLGPTGEVLFESREVIPRERLIEIAPGP